MRVVRVIVASIFCVATSFRSAGDHPDDPPGTAEAWSTTDSCDHVWWGRECCDSHTHFRIMVYAAQQEVNKMHESSDCLDTWRSSLGSNMNHIEDWLARGQTPCEQTDSRCPRYGGMRQGHMPICSWMDVAHWEDTDSDDWVRVRRLVESVLNTGPCAGSSSSAIPAISLLASAIASSPSETARRSRYGSWGPSASRLWELASAVLTEDRWQGPWCTEREIRGDEFFGPSRLHMGCR